MGIFKRLFLHVKQNLFFYAFLGFLVFVTGAFFSFSPYDSKLFYDDSLGLSVSNYFGKVGAFFASWVIYFFGFNGIFFLGFLFLAILVGFKVLNWKGELLRLVGILLFLVAGCGYFASLGNDFFAGIIPGGLLGDYLHGFIGENFLAWEGFVLFLGAWSGLILIFGVKWARPVRLGLETTWNFVVNSRVVNFLKAKIKELRKKFREAKKTVFPVGKDEGKNLEKMVQDIVDGKYASKESELYSDPIFKQLSNWNKVERKGQIEQSVEMDEEEDFFENCEIYEIDEKEEYVMPGFDLLEISSNPVIPQEDHTARAKLLEQKLEHFGIYGKVTSVTTGPIVTLFEYKPRVDIKISSIIAREDDLALALQALSLRIIAPIPGESVIGFEVANKLRNVVSFSDCIMSDTYEGFKGHLPIVLGKDITGGAYIIDLTGLPHLLLAGTTGSGKSVALHATLISLLYSGAPDELKLILVDPKRVEFGKFVDLPHLLFPIQVEVKDVIRVLSWAANTMDERYNKMADSDVRDIFEYHEKFGKKAMPFIVIVIDELADLMMMGGKDIEFLIVRIAQKARAAGIHLVLATQRPSVDVITGLIKVNFSARGAFRVASKIDSRVILDIVGAEKLVGKGDMLFLDGRGPVQRIHGSYISQKEIFNVVSFIKKQRRPEYIELPPEEIPEEKANGKSVVNNNANSDEALLSEIREFLSEVDEVSISYLQRKFKIGFNRSARIIEQLIEEGRILPSRKGKNKVLKE